MKNVMILDRLTAERASNGPDASVRVEVRHDELEALRAAIPRAPTDPGDEIARVLNGLKALTGEAQVILEIGANQELWIRSEPNLRVIEYDPAGAPCTAHGGVPGRISMYIDDAGVMRHHCCATPPPNPGQPGVKWIIDLADGRRAALNSDANVLFFVTSDSQLCLGVKVDP